MSGIDNFLNKKQSNYFITQQKETHPAIEASVTSVTPPISTEIRDEFVKTKKNNGLIRKFYNFLKNTTGIGLGSKTVEKEIDKYEKGEISKEEINNKISQYKISQENGAQSFGDVVTSAATISTFFIADNFTKKLRAQNKLNALPKIVQEALKHPPDKIKPYLKNIENILMSKTKTRLALLPILALTGGLTKLQTMQLERITSKEFKKDKTLDKQAQKADKKAKNKAKRNEDFKNFATGAVNGLLAPVTALAGGIVGVPTFLLGTTGLRYLTGKSENKSVENFTKELKDNAVVNTLTAAAIAIPSLKKAHFAKVIDTNLNKVVDKLKDVNLKRPDLPSSKTAYYELEDLMINSDGIQNILKTEKFGQKNFDEIITKLTDENIFAVKFLQIKNGGLFGGNQYNEISKALRENCPPTRTIEQAQEHINKLWGSDEYTVSKLLGVGTVAETYLAKNKSGKEVCIKVLKDGINAEKIAADKEKFIKLITGDTPLEKLNDNQKYLIKNVNDLAEGISKEVDFVNEMNAAKELKKHTKIADVVVPMDAKQGIYVMEKAPGISVKTLVDYYDAERELVYAKKYAAKDKCHKYWVEDVEKRIRQIKSRAPEFEAFDMTPAQIKKLLKTYMDLQIEQFSKINKNGKVIHADIHPGNIFINLEALKSGKRKLFTLIDTGNTINLSKEQTKASLKVVSFIKNGNYKDLTNIVLDGAVLPKGLTKEQAVQKIEADLKKYFFDSETKIDTMNMDTFYTLSENILRKYNIIPNNTQLNLNKAKISAQNSFEDLVQSFFNKKYSNITSDSSKAEKANAIKNMVIDSADIGIKLKTGHTIQESKNLLQMSPKEAIEFLRNKNMLKTNSEDYLTYEMKQNISEKFDEKIIEDLLD